MTRGIRNNNPLNIRKGSAWIGLSPVQSDKSFCQFKDMSYGIRAALIVLRTYHYKYKCDTIKDIISRFAPSKDGNNVESYCNLVVSYFLVNSTGVLHDEVVAQRENLVVNCWWNRHEPKLRVRLLVRAMAIVESNYPISFDEYVVALTRL